VETNITGCQGSRRAVAPSDDDDDDCWYQLKTSGKILSSFQTVKIIIL
jgi:hypothetical protein